MMPYAVAELRRNWRKRGQIPNTVRRLPLVPGLGLLVGAPETALGVRQKEAGAVAGGDDGLLDCASQVVVGMLPMRDASVGERPEGVWNSSPWSMAWRRSANDWNHHCVSLRAMGRDLPLCSAQRLGRCGLESPSNAASACPRARVWERPPRSTSKAARKMSTGPDIDCLGVAPGDDEPLDAAVELARPRVADRQRVVDRRSVFLIQGGHHPMAGVRLLVLVN
jgi:hypothetical protein